MLAFAANSLLCRAALSEGLIDAGSFTVVRLISGAATLLLLWFACRFSQESRDKRSLKASVYRGISLFGYAVFFSFAYISLAAGTGALLLFGTVQLTLIGLSFTQGYRFSKVELVGLAASIVGFVFLVLPSAEKPDVLPAVLMVLSGICWAWFTRLGQIAPSPQLSITEGFVVASMFSLVIVPFISLGSASTQGIVLAVLSGSITSAIGYFLWYRILPKMLLLHASIAQLSVPVFAIAMGYLFLGEKISAMELLLSGLILFGIAVTYFGKASKG